MNATVNEYQSDPAEPGGRGRAGLLALPRECLGFVVQRLVAARTQHRLPQPLQAEREQQRTDDESKVSDRDVCSAGPSAPTIAASTSGGCADASSVERQPRTIPTARTIVNASTASTPLARNVARKVSTACELTTEASRTSGAARAVSANGGRVAAMDELLLAWFSENGPTCRGDGRAIRTRSS